MQSALLSILGVLVGLLISEYFHRQRRIEPFSHQIFEKRLEAHEHLLRLCNAAYDEITDILNSDAPRELRESVVGKHIHALASFSDQNMLYLNEELTVHTTVTFIGAEDIPEIEDEDERESRLQDLRDNYKCAKDMIVAESGAAEINSHFQKVAKSQPDSDFIRYLRHMRGKNV